MKEKAEPAINFAHEIRDLRSAIALLEKTPGQLITTSEPVDPRAELAGIYRFVGAGTPTITSTKTGPAILFKRVKGCDDVKVITGVLFSRERTAILMGTSAERLPHVLLEALNNPIGPADYSGNSPRCQEVVHLEPLDVLKILPAPTNTELDAGPYFTMGLLRVEDPETGQSPVCAGAGHNDSLV